MAVYRALDGWRWRLVAPNGLIVADSGEAYTSRGNALRAAKRLSVVAGRAEVAVLATTDRSMDPPRR